MFTVGMPIAGELFFMYSTMLIAIPTGVKVFNWLSTMFKGSLTFETPMLFAIAFVALFTIGGLSGLMLAIASAVYYWLPKWTGYMYDEVLGKTHFWLSFISVNLTFFPMHFVGLAGMPRRIPDYAMQFADYNMIVSVGAFLFGLSQLLFLFNVLKCVYYGKSATAEVWEGAKGKGLEWTVDSPAPYHTFETSPDLTNTQTNN